LCVENEEGELGRGSYGVVELANHKKLGKVAIQCFYVRGGLNDIKMMEEQ